MKHTPTSPKQYDDRHLGSKHTYLQCRLAIQKFLTPSIQPFLSNGVSGQYILRLYGPAEHLNASEYKKRLADLSGYTVALLELAQAHQRPRCQTEVVGAMEGIQGEDWEAIHDAEVAEIQGGSPVAPVEDHTSTS